MLAPARLCFHHGIMPYDFTRLPFRELLTPVSQATQALARLDERIARSPVGAGLAERLIYSDTCASLYLDGALVPLEDLVLHDAGADVRAPTHELTIAHDLLRRRRRLLSQSSGWALTPEGMRSLLTSEDEDSESRRAPETKMRADDGEEEDVLSRELAAMDAVLARSKALLRAVQAGSDNPAAAGLDDDPEGINDAVDGGLDLPGFLDATAAFPPILRAALLLDLSSRSNATQSPPWLGRQLCAALIREDGLTSGLHLAPVSLGLRAVRLEDRLQRGRLIRLLSNLRGIQAGAEAALREHDRLMLARQRLERRLEGRRRSSRLPGLVDLVLSRPLVSSQMVSQALGITTHAALRLIEELDIRELTGRGRFRVWGIL